MDVPVFQLLVLFVLALVGAGGGDGGGGARLRDPSPRARLRHRDALRARLAGSSVYRLAGVRGRADGPRGDGLVWGEDGYVWTWLARSFENIMSELLQLAAFVVLTAFLIFEGSAESKDGDERMEAKIDAIASRLDEMQKGKAA